MELECEASVYIEEFMQGFFKEYTDVARFEEEFALEYGLEKSKADYFKLKRFLTTAIRNFREIDDKFIAGLLLKLQKDVYGLFDFFQKFTTLTHMPEIVYQRDFLGSLKPYMAILDEITSTKATRDLFEMNLKQLDGRMKDLALRVNDPESIRELKVTKDKYANAVHNFALARDKCVELSTLLMEYEKAFHDDFIATFNNTKSILSIKLTNAINTKAHYLDKLLWDRAEKNRRIVDFMAAANIVGNYDTKTFIKYYLRNINVDTSQDRDWHKYLKVAMEMLD